MQFKVPQDVQREDQILWFITLRQLIMLFAGGGISYMIFMAVSKRYSVNVIETILIALPFILAVAFAFVKIKGIPLFKFILLLIEAGLFRAPRRYWQGNSDVFISMTTQVSSTEKNSNTPITNPKTIEANKIKNLAALIDNK